ncbi:hypothetical protein [Burkholderia sp. NLJ2]|uniref:hypothetical protein n=1 Tax=Burkholderia sp. NLJ2 TaxID=3090699 RepID=UPI003C6C095B
MLREAHLQLGVAVERARDVRVARDRVLDPVHRGAVRAADHERIAARLVGAQREVESGRRNRQRLLVDRHFLQPRIVFVCAGILLGQHRHVAFLDELRTQVLHVDRLRTRVDRDEPHRARAAALHVAEIVDRLVADEPVVVRHERLRVRGDVAPAFRFIRLRLEVELVGRVRVLVEIEVELGMAVVVGRAVLQRRRITFLRAACIEEVITLPAAERRPHRAQRQRRRDAALLGRRAEQVLRIDDALQPLRLHPPFDDLLRQLRVDLHPVGQELLHLHRRAADRLGARLAGLDDIQIDRPRAGRRRFGRRITKFREARRVDGHRLAFDGDPARVDDLRLQRHAGRAARPARRAHDQADVERIAGPVQAAIREQVRGQLPLARRVAFAVDVETRKIELAIAARHRQERQVAVLLHDIQLRTLLAVEPLERGEMHDAVGARGLREQRLAVHREHRHGCARNRAAVADRLDEHVLAAVQRALDQHPEIGHDDQARVAERFVAVVAVAVARIGIVGLILAAVARRCIAVLRIVGFLLLGRRVVLRQVQQEHAALAALQVLAEIDAFVMRLAGVAGRERTCLHEALDDVILAERIRQLGPRVRAVVEAHEMLELVGHHPADLDLHPRQVARYDRQPLAAAHRQQRAVGHEAQQLRIVGHRECGRHRRAEQVAARRFQVAFETHDDAVARRRVILEALQRREVVLGRHRCERQRLRLLQHRVTDVGHVPFVRRIVVRLIDARLAFRQHPRLRARGEIGAAHAVGRFRDEHLLGLVALVVDERRRDVADCQAVEPRHADRRVQHLWRTVAAAHALHALVDVEPHRQRIARNLERLRVDPRARFHLVVVDRVAQRRHGLAVAADQHEADALLELGRIDRIVEAQLQQRLLLRRIVGVLVELVVARRRGEGRQVEREMVVVHRHLRREHLVHRETHLDVRADRPVGRRREAQRLVVDPLPRALQRGRHFDALPGRLADPFDRRGRSGEHHFERMHGDLRLVAVVDLVGRDRRRLHGEADGLGLGRLRAMLEPIPAVTERGREQHDAAGMPRAAAHGRGGDARPRGRRPRHVADQRPQHAAEQAPDEARRTNRQEQQEAQQIHFVISLFKDVLPASAAFPEIYWSVTARPWLRRECLELFGSTGCWAPLSVRAETMEISACRRATRADDGPVGWSSASPDLCTRSRCVR